MLQVSLALERKADEPFATLQLVTHTPAVWILNFRVRYGNGWNPSGMITRCGSMFEARCARFELELFSSKTRIKNVFFIRCSLKTAQSVFLVIVVRT